MTAADSEKEGVQRKLSNLLKGKFSYSGKLDRGTPIYRDGIGLDSLESLELAGILEDDLKIHIDNGEWRGIITFGGLVDYISAKIGGETST